MKILTSFSRAARVLAKREFEDTIPILPFGVRGMPTSLAHHTWLGATPTTLFFYEASGIDLGAGTWAPKAGATAETLTLVGAGAAPTVASMPTFTDSSLICNMADASGQCWAGANNAVYQLGEVDYVIACVVIPKPIGLDWAMGIANTGSGEVSMTLGRNATHRWAHGQSNPPAIAVNGLFTVPLVSGSESPVLIVSGYSRGHTSSMACGSANGVTSSFTGHSGLGPMNFNGVLRLGAINSMLAGRRSRIAMAAMWYGPNLFTVGGRELSMIQLGLTAQQLYKDIYRGVDNMAAGFPSV